MINLSFVKPKNKLKIDKYNSELLNLICDKIKEIDNHPNLKWDNELLKFVCECIENGLHSDNENKQKTNKKQLCIDVYTKVFTLNEAEKVILTNSIQFLCDNKLIIKFSHLEKYSTIMFNYIKSKL